MHASNLPQAPALNPVQDTPEVALAKRRHLEQLRRAESLQTEPQRRPSPYLLSAEEARDLPAPRPAGALLPRPEARLVSLHRGQLLVPATVYAMPLPMLRTSMRHSQDSLGRYEYSYTGDTSAKTESRELDGTTRGAYSYIDANGLLQQVHYIADRGGFRVLATNLPGA